ncbi:DUF1127 domain-containing protein [Pseudooceanicola sp. CBS1P-1]|uniref:DUF1127 domain-containing protein n=1 Tax=Pseudooceanicola albus TaxID=2692189 RepID=A0A6L7G6U0_9RHOB|nr:MULTISPECIES: DUF1127 domain-containing protein [Pseudooceanicola]MBT9383060.1 DUF1127 domain-containing protein [Pseudooceanicola endophyticus]MXN19248.1 DUF1127 domain-containing protein [Pseudooceanicola albus]
MAMATETRPAKISLFDAVLDNLHARYARYTAYRRALEELSSLDARELADLGLSRAMIHSIARQEAYGAAA